jgi:hypothetical protein
VSGNKGLEITIGGWILFDDGLKIKNHSPMSGDLWQEIRNTDRLFPDHGPDVSNPQRAIPDPGVPARGRAPTQTK